MNCYNSIDELKVTKNKWNKTHQLNRDNSHTACIYIKKFWYKLGYLASIIPFNNNVILVNTNKENDTTL